MCAYQMRHSFSSSSYITQFKLSGTAVASDEISFKVTPKSLQGIRSLLEMITPSPFVVQMLPPLDSIVILRVQHPGVQGWVRFVKSVEMGVHAHARVLRGVVTHSCMCQGAPCRGSSIAPALYFAGADESAGVYVTLYEHVHGVPLTSTLTPYKLARVERALFTCWLLGVGFTPLTLRDLVTDGNENVRIQSFRNARSLASWRVGAIAAAITQPATFSNAWSVANQCTLKKNKCLSDVQLLRSMRQKVNAGTNIDALLVKARQSLWSCSRA